MQMPAGDRKGRRTIGPGLCEAGNMKSIVAGAIFLAWFLTAAQAAMLDIGIVSSSDDAVENGSGIMTVDGNALALRYRFIVGLRFQNIALPLNANIRSAYLEFDARRDDADAASFLVVGAAESDAAPMTANANDLSNRTETVARYAWNPVPAWTTSSLYQTGDIGSVIREIIGTAGWTSGNAMLMMIKQGTGCTSSTCRRRAYASDLDALRAPSLHIDYGTPPVVGTIPDFSRKIGQNVSIDLSPYVNDSDADSIAAYVLGGTLPDGLDFNGTTGFVTGTPTTLEARTLTLFVTDQDGDSNSVEFNIVIGSGSPPVMQDVQDTILAVGGSYVIELSNDVTPTDGDPVLSYVLTGNLPSGLSFNSASGVISGTPSGEESQTLAVYATDADGNSSSDEFLLSVIDTNGLALELRMDECYWLGGANGVDDDVADTSGFHLDAQSRNEADNSQTNFKICRAGDFNNTYTDQSLSDAVFYPNETAQEKAVGENAPFSVAAWVYRNAGNDKWMAAVIKIGSDAWEDGWGMVHTNGAGNSIDFFVGRYDVYARATVPTNTWTHVVGTYDGTNIRIYINGVLQSTTAQANYSAGSLAVSVGDDISGSAIDDRWQGYIDEVKIWHRTLIDTEVASMYANEDVGLNYDGTTRSCDSCNGVDVLANTWEFIGVPADARASGGKTVNAVLGDDMGGMYETDWRVYKRTYSTTTNASSYTLLSVNDTMAFGQGFWLGSMLDARWDVDGLDSVDYNSSYNATAGCVSATTRCVEIALTSTTKDFEVDPDDGSGPYRYNMLGAIGIENPVEWADCRFVFDDNGTFYTPTDANASGLAGKQIWLYDPTDGSANSNGYITCSDTSPGGCKLVPFEGFWVQLNGQTKNHSVKLIIPEK